MFSAQIALNNKELTQMDKTDLLEQAAAKREQLFMDLYKKTFPTAARYISKMGGSFDEAKDVFQDALVIYYEKVIAGSTKPLNGEKAYILGITKHLWIRKFNTYSKNVTLDDTDLADSLADDQEISVSSKLMHFMESAGRKCMDLLRAFYYDKTPMTELAEQFGYASPRSATVQKYKCLEKVREEIKQKELSYADFLD